MDWGRKGAPLSHIMARRERFDEETLRNCESKNPYYNFPEYMEIEERYGVRSTFFFRTYVSDSLSVPPCYRVEEYKQEIRALVNGGWEIGLHMDPFSHSQCAMIKKEKEALENITGAPIYGNRVHNTLNSDLLYRNFLEVGFKYDSSPKFNRETIVERDFGYFMKDHLIVFPITVMDALIFAYLTDTEDDVVKLIRRIVEKCNELPRKERIITVLWHDCVLKMNKGRRYSEVLDYLVSRKDVEIRRGIDLVAMIEKEKL